MSSNTQYRLPSSTPIYVSILLTNVSVAKDRSWFGDDYVAFDSIVSPVLFDDNGTAHSHVIGVGSVSLPTKTGPYKSGPRSHGTIHLKNFLHIPDFTCNIVGGALEEDYYYMGYRKPGTNGFICSRSDERQVAYFQPERTFHELRLSGFPVGPRVGPWPEELSRQSFIWAWWPESEKLRFQAEQNNPHSKVDEKPPLTSAETAWLAQAWGGESKFLQFYDLSIDEDEDRIQGRLILRHMLIGLGWRDRQDDEESQDDEDSQDDEEFYWEDPLTSVEEAWMYENWKNEVEFLRAHHLSIDNEKDRSNGRLIVRANLTEDAAKAKDAEKAKAARDAKHEKEGDGETPLTSVEQAWLKENWENEFEFLRAHGLSIHKEEDRAEGRWTLRSILAEDDEDAEDAKDEEDDGDAPLTFVEQAWLEDNWNGEFDFLRAHGLSIYKEEDRAEGRWIVRSILAGDGEDDEDDEEDGDAGDAGDNKEVATGGVVPFDLVAFTVQHTALSLQLIDFSGPKKKD